MDINWIKAPEWAKGHGLVVQGGPIKEVWFGDQAYMIVGDSRSYPFGGGDGATQHNHTPIQFQFKTMRPEPWTGEGLPPAGTVCELTERVLLADAEDADWFEEGTHVEVGGHAFFKTAVSSVCTICVAGENFTGTLAAECLRPIRTPEQIAAEERRTAIGEMLDIFKSNYEGHPSDGLQALYDAGYRRQVAP